MCRDNVELIAILAITALDLERELARNSSGKFPLKNPREPRGTPQRRARGERGENCKSGGNIHAAGDGCELARPSDISIVARSRPKNTRRANETASEGEESTIRGREK
jgi:hypothetical protein